MSIRCVAEQYNASRISLRISADYVDADMDSAAIMLASEVERLFVVDGSNIFNNIGRWKGESENGRTVEVVVRGETVDNDRMQAISYFVNVTMGMTCFATVEPTTAYELYELAE